MIFEKSDIIEEPHRKVNAMKLCLCGAKLERIEGDDWLHPPKEIQLSVYEIHDFGEEGLIFIPNEITLEDVKKEYSTQTIFDYRGKIIATCEFINNLQETSRNGKVWYEELYSVDMGL